MVVTGDKFELAVLVITLLNLVAMAIEHEGMSDSKCITKDKKLYVV